MIKLMMRYMIVIWVLINTQSFVFSQEDTDLCEGGSIEVVTWRDTGTEFAIGSCDGVYRYDAETMTLIERIERRVQRQMAYQPGGDLLAFGTPDGLVLWDLDASEHYTTLDGAGILSWDETGERLAFSSLDYDLISVVDVETLDVIHTMEAPKELIFHIDWEAENAIRFVDNFELFTWYVDSNQITRYTLPFHVGWGWGDANNTIWFEDAVIIFPGVVGAGANGTMGVWWYRQGRWEVIRFEDMSLPTFWSVAVHPQENVFAVGSRQDVYVFGANTIALLSTQRTNEIVGVPVPGCSSDALDENQLYDSIAWHPDGESLLVVSPCRMAIIPMDE